MLAESWTIFQAPNQLWTGVLPGMGEEVGRWFEGVGQARTSKQTTALTHPCRVLVEPPTGSTASSFRGTLSCCQGKLSPDVRDLPKKRDLATSSNSLILLRPRPVDRIKSNQARLGEDQALYLGGNQHLSIGAYPLKFSQGPGHPYDKLVAERSSSCRRTTRWGGRPAQGASDQVQVKDFGHLVLYVLGHLADVIISADASAGLP